MSHRVLPVNFSIIYTTFMQHECIKNYDRGGSAVGSTLWCPRSWVRTRPFPRRTWRAFSLPVGGLNEAKHFFCINSYSKVCAGVSRLITCLRLNLACHKDALLCHTYHVYWQPPWSEISAACHDSIPYISEACKPVRYYIPQSYIFQGTKPPLRGPSCSPHHEGAVRVIPSPSTAH